MTVLSQPEIVKRLAFVRHLYNLGVGQINSPFPAASMLCLHDAIEIVLQLGIEHHGVSTSKNIEFLPLFDALDAKVGGLEGRDGLKRLNEARIAVKHKALQLSAEEMRRCRSRSQVFLEKNCPKLLQLEFFSFSMSDSIVDDNIRTKIQSAELALSAGEPLQCAEAAAEAFNILEGHKFFFGVEVPMFTFRDRYLNKIVETINKLESMIKFDALGIPYSQRQLFISIVPTIQIAISGRKTIILKRATHTVEQLRFCVDFVIKATLAVEQHERQLAQGLA